MKENDDIKEEKDKEPTKRSHDREIKKGDNQDEKRSKKGLCSFSQEIQSVIYSMYYSAHNDR